MVWLDRLVECVLESCYMMIIPECRGIVGQAFVSIAMNWQAEASAVYDEVTAYS